MSEIEKFKQERDEALALADARGRALEELFFVVSHVNRSAGEDLDLEWATELLSKALSLPAPEALAKQREYVGALERVAEAARHNPAWLTEEAASAIYQNYPIDQWEGCWKAALGLALGELDAVKGGR